MFDVNAFGSTQTEEASSVDFIPVPEDEYPMVIDKFQVKQYDESVMMKVMMKIDAPEVEDANERVVPYDCWLDITPSGTLDNRKGKNVRLGRLRAAIGQNTPGVPWAPDMIVGQPLKGRVKNEVNNDTGEIFSKVVAVSQL